MLSRGFGETKPAKSHPGKISETASLSYSHAAHRCRFRDPSADDLFHGGELRGHAKTRLGQPGLRAGTGGLHGGRQRALRHARTSRQRLHTAERQQEQSAGRYRHRHTRTGGSGSTACSRGKVRCEFVPRTDHPLGALNFGFDTPITGDSSRATGDGSKKDEELQEFWASVTKTGNTDDPGYDPHLNTSVAVQFDSADVAKDYKLVVPTAFNSMLSVTPTELTAKNTPITLTGAAGNPDVQTDARVEVQHKVTGQIIQILKVKVLPLITVDLGIFRVEDSVDLSAGHAKKSQLDSTLPDNAAIIKDLNRFFIQCGVRFTLNGNSHNFVAANALHFDVGQPNGILDSGKENDPEMIYLKNESQIKTGKLNLVILHGLSANGADGNKAGFCPVSDTDPSIINGNQVFVFSTYYESLASGDATRAFSGFKQVCAHELGHALGLSTRANYDPEHNKTDTHWTRNHDLGFFPVEVDLQGDPKEGPPDRGLMYPEASYERRWVRHEDWFKANNTAKGFR